MALGTCTCVVVRYFAMAANGRMTGCSVSGAGVRYIIQYYNVGSLHNACWDGGNMCKCFARFDTVATCAAHGSRGILTDKQSPVHQFYAS